MQFNVRYEWNSENSFNAKKDFISPLVAERIAKT